MADALKGVMWVYGHLIRGTGGMQVALATAHNFTFDWFSASFADWPEVATVVIPERRFPRHQRPYPQLGSQIVVAVALSRGHHDPHRRDKRLRVVEKCLISFLRGWFHLRGLYCVLAVDHDTALISRKGASVRPASR